jgi:hypothetical protein
MSVKSVDVPDPVGDDGPGGATEVDAKQYHTFMV